MEEIARRICEKLPRENDYNVYTVLILTDTVARGLRSGSLKERSATKSGKK